MNNTSDTPKRFEEYPKVDCNECVHYWDDSCSGVKPTLSGSTKLCTAFLATRQVDIPLQIKFLRNAIKWITRLLILMSVWMVIATILILVGG